MKYQWTPKWKFAWKDGALSFNEGGFYFCFKIGLRPLGFFLFVSPGVIRWSGGISLGRYHSPDGHVHTSTWSKDYSLNPPAGVVNHRSYF